ncbi:hypothetical protein ACHMXB_01500 [Arthrobacter sp. UC242_113]|uniref:hypothetical protein n=1 Tax=Arthrobacter sp. UC242_113 TaxID=3374550 RepID=UPI00375777CB
MTNTLHNEPLTTAVLGKKTPFCIDTFDLTPAGLSDAPANQEDSGSIVHTGNS